MKKLIYSAALVMSLTTLVACGAEETKEETPTAQEVENNTTASVEETETKEEAPVQEEAETDEEVIESELGKMTVTYKNKEVNQAFESGPIKASLNKIQVATLEVATDYKYMFNEQDVVTVVTAEMTVENTVDDTINFYPDQATIVTDTKQQIEADMLLSDSIGGEFLGQVKKEGNVIWVLKPDENIKNVSIHISAAHGDDLSSLSEDIKLDIPVQ